MIRTITSKIPALAILMVLLMISTTSWAAEQTKKIKPKVRMSYIHYSDTGSEIHVKAYYKPKGGGTVACTGAVLRLMNSDGDVLNVRTVGEDANVIFTLADEELAFFSDSNKYFYSFIAELDGGDTYRDRDSDLDIWPSEIKADFLEEDSLKSIKAVFMGSDDSGKIVPVEDALLKFYVKRLIFPLPVGGNADYTDKKGETSIEFPLDLPGDEHGNITILIQLEDDDRYGTVVLRENLNWGTELDAENHFNSRSLISPGNNAPWFMVIIISSALIGVWGVMILVIVNFFRIRTIGKKIALK